MLPKFIPIDRLIVYVDRTTSKHDQELLSTLVKHKKQGFSLLEILITMLVISGFLIGSLQATVLATLLKIQAQEKQEAINWTQKDLELMRYKAFVLDYDQNNCGNYAETLEANLIASGFLKQQDDILINQKEYRIERNYVQKGDILQINHAMKYNLTHPRYKNPTSDNLATQLSTEVLPNAALSC